MAEDRADSYQTLQNFLNMYGSFLSETTNLNTDIETILKDISKNINKPNSNNPQLLHLYQYGKSLNKDVASDIVPRIKNLKQQALADLILNIEQLNSKLMIDYENEVKRGVQLGIYQAKQ